MKRSAQIGVIILGGAVGVGSLAYLASPTDRCRTDPAYEAIHASECASRSGTSSGSGSRSYFGGYGSNADTTNRGTGASTAAASGSVERGGFGSFMRSVSSHFSSGS